MHLNKFMAWGAVGIWMAIIFSFSAQVGSDSGNLSGSILSFVASIWQFFLPHIAFNQEIFHLIIRKGAHFSVYFFLGLLTTNAFKTNGISGRKRFGFALLVCVLYAASDEFHQSFVPGRGPSFQDVLIDSAGATLGISLYQLFGK